MLIIKEKIEEELNSTFHITVGDSEKKLFGILCRLLFIIIILGAMTTSMIWTVFKVLDFNFVNIYPFGFPISSLKIESLGSITDIFSLKNMGKQATKIYIIGIILRLIFFFSMFIMIKTYKKISKTKAETETNLKIMDKVISPILKLLILITGIFMGIEVEDKLMTIELVKKMVWILWLYISPEFLTMMLNIRLLRFK